MPQMYGVTETSQVVTLYVTPEELEKLAAQARRVRAEARLGESLVFHEAYVQDRDTHKVTVVRLVHTQ